MRARTHLKRLAVVTVAWAIFWIIGRLDNLLLPKLP